ncbi:MAG TPA: hypothetical protein VEU28_02910 [Actinomycetota bacterium]|nr:hypothetical protein [Actinomycetota bacterium]
MTIEDLGSDRRRSGRRLTAASVDILLAQAAGALALTVCVLLGLGWGGVAFGVWLLAYIRLLVRSGRRAVAAGRTLLLGSGVVALVAGAPLLAAGAYLAPSVVNPGSPLVALGVLALAVVAGWFGVVVVLLVRRRRGGGTASLEGHGGRPRTILAVGAVTALLFSMPLGAEAASRRSLEDRIRRCPGMAPQLPGASRWMLRILAEACSQTAAQAHRPGEQLVVHAGSGEVDFNAVAAAAQSMVDHFTAHLGPSPLAQIAVHPVAIPGAIRGMAGPGYLLIDQEELASPEDCGAFRSSAGTDGVCGVWVLAHEMAHEWFPGAADLGPSADEVAWEGTADYLAWDWWRQEYGDADASRLREELFEGRIALAPEFAASNAPGYRPPDLTSAQSRALVYGRGSLAWVAAEAEAGREGIRAVLRSALEGMDDGALTVGSILRAAEQFPEVAEVLESWWMDASFEPEFGRP